MNHWQKKYVTSQFNEGFTSRWEPYPRIDAKRNPGLKDGSVKVWAKEIKQTMHISACCMTQVHLPSLVCDSESLTSLGSAGAQRTKDNRQLDKLTIDSLTPYPCFELYENIDAAV